MFTDISPNKMARIVNCPGSVNLCRKFSSLLPSDNDWARQGVLANWLAKQNLVNGLGCWRFLNKSPINDQIVDREMIVNISNYCQIIKNIVINSPISHTNVMVVEQRQEIKKGEFAGFAGISDFMHYDAKTCRLTIIDLNYGFTHAKVLENWKLLSYVWLFINVHPYLHIDSVNLGIYQPRIVMQDGNYRTWDVTFGDLEKVYFPKIEESLRSCQSLTSTTKTGEHCYHCCAMIECENNLKTCLKVIDLTQVQSAKELTGGQLSDQLKLFRFGSGILKKRLQVIEATTEHRLKNGKHVPGYTLGMSNGNRYWDISDENAARIGIPKTQKLMTPRQVEKDGFSQELFDKYVKIRRSIKLMEVNMDKISQQLGPSKEV